VEVHQSHSRSLKTDPLASNRDAAKLSPGEIALGLWGGDLAGLRHLDLSTPFLSRLTSLQGCGTEVWDEILFAFRVKGGCLSCSTPQGDMLRYFNSQSPACIAGKFILSVSSFLATPERRLGEQTDDALKERAVAVDLLQEVESDLAAAMQADGMEVTAASVQGLFFDIFGVTPTQIRYVLQHTWLGYDYPAIFDYNLNVPTDFHLGQSRPSKVSEADRDLGDRLIWDLGMSGGMDSLYYLVHGFKVLSVEANPMLALDVRTALQRYGDQVHIIAAAIISDISESDKNSGAAPALVSEPQKQEVDFHIHKERPDFSALDDDRVPRHMLAGTVRVRAVSCSELVAEFGRQGCWR